MLVKGFCDLKAGAGGLFKHIAVVVSEKSKIFFLLIYRKKRTILVDFYAVFSLIMKKLSKSCLCLTLILKV